METATSSLFCFFVPRNLADYNPEHLSCQGAKPQVYFAIFQYFVKLLPFTA
ncbi:MAG: hypothetical protein RSB59_06245 [Clostridia bacterium]